MIRILEKISLNNNNNIDLMNILSNHLDGNVGDRKKVINESCTLLYQIISNTREIQEDVDRLIEKVYKNKEVTKNE